MKNGILLKFIACYIFFLYSISTAAQQVKITGDANVNTIRKAKVMDNNFYQGVQALNNQGLLIKNDLAGNQIWQVELSDNFIILDFAKREDTILVVGFITPNPYDAVMAKIIDGPAPTLDFIRVYDFDEDGLTGRRDAFTQIIKKPNSDNNFYVQTYFVGISSDDVGILEFDGSGNYITGNFYDEADDQFWQGLKEESIDLTFKGNTSTGPQFINGTYVELNPDLSVKEGYYFTEVETITDYLDRTSDRKILVGHNFNPDRSGVILQVNSLGDIAWAYEIPESRTISQIIFNSYATISNGYTETFFITGDFIDDVSGDFKTYVAKLTNTQTSGDGSRSMPSTQTLDWVRHLDDGSGEQVTQRLLKNGSNLYFTDRRHNPTGGFGNGDVMQLITDLELTSCITVDLSWSLVDYTTSTGSVAPTAYSDPYVSPTTIAASSVISFSEYLICDDPISGICEESCNTTELDFSTGHDYSGAPITTGMHTSKWRVVSTPPSSGIATSPPLFPFILNTPSAWSNIPGAKYISPLPNINSSFDNIGNNTSFDFETCFCVCADNSEVTIDLSAYADNALIVDLFDASLANGGSLHTNLLDIPSSAGTGAFNGDTFDSNHVLNLNEGQYCIKAQLQNDGTVYMGFSMNATVSGAGLITAECCETISNGLTGFVYDDKNCNGQYEMNIDELHSGAVMTVCNDAGVDIASTTTDDYGLYTFDDLGPGDFTVKYTAQPDYELIQEPSFPAMLTESQVIGGLNFGLNYTGPTTTEPFETTCLQAGGQFTFEWCGQSCECSMSILARPCDSSDEFELIASVPNTRKFTWTVPINYSGDYEFVLEDCDGNQTPFQSCLSVVDYEMEIEYNKIDCGTYQFSATLIGSSITDYYWTFEDYQNSSSSNPTIEFLEAGDVTICLTATDAEGCIIKDCINLYVSEAAGDDCNFCEANPMVEIELGDLFIYDDCYGVIITSPNGSCFRIKVGDDGTLFSEPIDCPGAEEPPSEGQN